MRFYRTGAKRWRFSMAEAAVVLVVLGVISGIVKPRMSRATGSDPAVGEQVLVGHLAALRRAIEAYAADHGGEKPDRERIAEQLLGFTDREGQVGPGRSERFCYGPYLGAIPPLPVGERRGLSSIGPEGGWRYEEGVIRGNLGSGERDGLGVAYVEY